MRVLVLNCGSSSVKFQVVEVDGTGRAQPRAERQPRGAVAGIGGDAEITFVDAGGGTHRTRAPIADHIAALGVVLDRLGSAGGPPCRVDAVGHRVVHGGERFSAPTRIDAATLDAIAQLDDMAPLHNPACVRGIEAARRVWGEGFPMVAVFDTAFHRTLPAVAATYALPRALARRHGIRRYGFHGIAHQSVAARFAALSGRPLGSLRLITVHLGSGCSITAIRDGMSIDTSMGLTPLAGLIMGTRSGDVDPAVVSYLARRERVSPDVVERWLNERSGLLGLSGVSADMHVLAERMAADPDARLAVDSFCYRASQYVAAYCATLGGADAVAFSGGIGEHSPPVRAAICARLAWCGVRLDAARNDATVGREARISADDGIPVYVIGADEEGLIAEETRRCLGAPGPTPAP